MKETEIQSKPFPDFDIRTLEDFDFGLADGEKDNNLKASFILTKSIRKLLKRNYNYVLSPKGAGKSATFKAINDKFLPKEFIDYNKYHIVAINKAFETDNNYLSPKRFKSDLEHKKYTVSWALYIAIKLIEDILTNFSGNEYLSEFESQLKKYGDFKEKYELYNILDYLDKVNFALKFSSNGQDLTVNPSVKLKNQRKKISLNEIFQLINNFYYHNELTVKVLVDRVDNFVQKEEYEIQKNYLQGLVDSIEEITNLSNIKPLLFLRTDLFFSHTLNFEFDKLADRILELKWTNDEILYFMTSRFLSNEYINNNFQSFFNNCIKDELKNKIDIKKDNFLKKAIRKIFPKEKSFDINKDINYKIAERFLKLFFNSEIEHLNSSYKDEKIEFCNWIFTHFVDTNNFINPRLILRFLQILIDKQYEVYTSHNILSSHLIKAELNSGYMTFDLFMKDVIKTVYSKVQNEQLKTIFKLQNTKVNQALFRKINQLSMTKSVINYGDVNLKQFDTDKENYNRLIKYLVLLGYLKEVEIKKYVTSPLYKKELDLTVLSN